MTSQSTSTSSGAPTSSHQNIKDYLLSNYVNTATYFTRMFTLYCSLAFFVAPMLTGGGVATASTWYQRTLLANAATSSLRLRQRINQNQLAFSRECLANLLAEDSMHYLFFSMIFIMVPPVTVALVPIFCFALLHSVSFTETLLRISSGRTSRPEGDGPTATGGQTSTFTNFLQTIISKVRNNDRMILRMVAVNEILLMFIAIILAFSGPQVLMLPIMYYQFLRLRYASRRSPYSRYAFAELRMALQQLAAHPYCPAFVARVIYFFITFVSNRCPPVSTT